MSFILQMLPVGVDSAQPIGHNIAKRAMQHSTIKKCAYYLFQESVAISARHENRSDLPNSNFWCADFVKNWQGSFDSKLDQVMRKQVRSQCYCDRQIDQAVYTASCLLEPSLLKHCSDVQIV